MSFFFPPIGDSNTHSNLSEKKLHGQLHKFMNTPIHTPNFHNNSHRTRMELQYLQIALTLNHILLSLPIEYENGSHRRP